MTNPAAVGSMAARTRPAQERGPTRPAQPGADASRAGGRTAGPAVPPLRYQPFDSKHGIADAGWITDRLLARGGATLSTRTATARRRVFPSLGRVLSMCNGFASCAAFPARTWEDVRWTRRPFGRAFPSWYCESSYNTHNLCFTEA